MSQHILERILEEEDKKFVRVLEDLIVVLVEQNVISLDMLPEEAGERFRARQRIRNLVEAGALEQPPQLVTVEHQRG